MHTDYLCPPATIYDRNKQVGKTMFQLERVNILRILGRGVEVINFIVKKKENDDWRE
jgi:hypothetical protein